jgi:DNA-binding transcriptional LysR family regulator
MLKEAFATRDLPPPAERVSASSIPLRNRLLATGRFLTMLTNSVLHYNATQWGLKALPVDLRITPPSIAILTLKNRTLSPVAQLLIDHLRESARAMKTLLRPKRPL